MVNIKKQVINSKMYSFLEKNTLVLCYHCNNIDRKEWNLIKTEIQKIVPVTFMMAKNKIATKVIALNNNTEAVPFCLTLYNKKSSRSPHICYHTNNTSIKTEANFFAQNLENLSLVGAEKSNVLKNGYALFQGPTLMIGCHSLKELCVLSQLLDKKKDFLFLGGFYQKKIINHMEFSRLVNLGDQIYKNLLQKLQNPLKPILLLKNGMEFLFLYYYQQKLIYILRHKSNSI